MKYLPLLLLLLASPVNAITWNQFWRPFNNGTYHRSPVYYNYNSTCSRLVYREQYIPGNGYRYGYVRTWTERVRVPCGYH